jgi:hypothetical protein
VQGYVARITAFAIYRHGDFPMGGKFDRVIDKIRNDLPKPDWIAHEYLGYLRIGPDSEFEAFRPSADRKSLERLVHAIA